YESRGMNPFEYAPGKVIKTYYQVPVDVLEDDAELSQWARAAVGAQKRRGAGKATKKKPRKIEARPRRK
ncbi:MAG TPA: TfoX/Sxy family protein, partial [Candidatus Krumholzibacteria bacterium]|nr:TfoX/Sxy family protein [Candidatus Krumholzibacteria bacterium]